jgi:hypothetical protein
MKTETTAAKVAAREPDPPTGIMSAFVAALTQMKNPALDKTNGHFRDYRYASLASHVAAAKGVLADHDLVLVQPVWMQADGRLVIRTTVFHGSTGESLQLGEFGFMPHPTDPQKTIGSLTYFRRASLAAALGIVGDDDDDAEMVSSDLRPKDDRPATPKVTVAQAIAKQVSDRIRSDIRDSDPKPIGEVMKQAVAPAVRSAPANGGGDWRRCKVVKVTEKEGNTRGKPWTRFAILVEHEGENVWLSTFTEDLGKLAKTMVGREVEIEAKEGKVGMDLLGMRDAKSVTVEDQDDDGEEVSDDDIPF